MPRSLNGILALSVSSNLKVPPICPYNWNSGDHDIPKIMANVPIIAMAYCHEGGEVTAISEEIFIAANAVMTAGNGTDAEVSAAAETVIMFYISRDYATYVNWYIVLVACTQVRELTDSNIDNFSRMCAGKAIPTAIRKFLHYWANSQDRLLDDIAVRAKFITNKFFEYHTISCSTPDLCIRAYNESSFLNIFSDDEVTVINDALRNVSDLFAARSIPNITVVKARAVLDASNMLPDTWYMGTQALSRFSGRKYNGMVTILRRIFELRNNTATVATDDLPTLVTKLRDLVY